MKKLIIVVDTAAFQMFDAGLKPYEYRGITPRWKKRLENRDYDVVEFRKGYTKTAIQFEYLGATIGLPNPDYIPKSKTRYGFNPEEEVFKIKLGKRI